VSSHRATRHGLTGLSLIAATDAHFAWLLGEVDAPDQLRLPPSGIDQPWVYGWLRGTLPALGEHGSWLMVADGEAVGLCSYKAPPGAAGDVEIGYGVAPERRRLGHATRAVSLIVEEARQDTRVRAVRAETALANLPSQRVLEANGFVQVGRGMDHDEGETIVWRLELR
jgi:RimJ/RimL family protein N-acetyltransferase